MKKAMLTGITIAAVSMMFLLGGCGVSDQPKEAEATQENEIVEIQDEPECVTADEPERINADEPECITTDEPECINADEPEDIDADEEYDNCLPPEEEEYTDDVDLSMDEDVYQKVFDEIKDNMPGDWTYRNDIDNVVCDMYFAEDGSIKLEAYDYDHDTEDLAGGTWRVVRDGDEAVLVIRMSNKFYNFETRWALCDCYFDGTVDLSGLSFFYDTEINATGYFTKAY